jgi:hypothetical protein
LGKCETQIKMYFSKEITKRSIFKTNKKRKVKKIIKNTIIAFLALLLLPALNASLVAQHVNVDNTVINVGTGYFISTGGSFHIQNSGAIDNSGTVKIPGNWTNDANGLVNASPGTVELNGTTVQTIGGNSVTTFNNLTINNSNGVMLAGNIIVNGTLTFTSGKITTGSNYVILGSSASIVGAGAGKYVNGNLRRFIPAITNGSVNFDIGDAINYTPVQLTFAGTPSGASSIDAATSIAAPPVASGISQTQYVNRQWNLSNNGVTGFTSYNATFNFVAGDVIGGANTANFIAANYNAPNWTLPAVGVRTSTSTEITGATAFGAFALGTVAGTGPATQLRTVDCGRITFNLQSSIVADAVAGASQYEFQFKDAGDASVVATRLQTSRTLVITNVSPALQWGTNYMVRVRPIIGTAVGTYGAPCNIGFLPDPSIFGIPATQLATSNCGKLNYLLASSITANLVIGATQYEFEFRNVSTNALVATKIQTNNFTTLSSVTPALQWGTQYNVRVRAYYGTIAGTFGNTCLIGLIPDPATSGVPNTQLSNGSCNKTGLSLTGNITCIAVTGANQYEWEFTNPVGGALVALKTTTTSTCVISSVSPALQWGTQYNVRVRAFIAGTGGVFANTCLIGFIPDPATSGVPTSRLNSMSCGNQNLTIQSSVVALTVNGANQYEFEFSNPSNSVVVATKTSTSATCFLNSVTPALQWGTQYNVRVRAFIAGTAGTFGNICLIALIPNPAIFGVPATQIRTLDCERLNFTLNSSTAATAVAGATQYEFEFSDPNTNAVVATKLQTSATLSLSSVTPALQAGTTYNVRVRAYINSFQGTYGNVCLIGFASGARFNNGEEGTHESADNVAGLAVFPNPYSSASTLVFSTTENETAIMNVFDMSGRLVEQKMIQTNTNVVFGENFEKGVYIIQVNSTSGEQINTRLIKN